MIVRCPWCYCSWCNPTADSLSQHRCLCPRSKVLPGTVRQHGKRGALSCDWAEVNCWNSWAGEDSSASSISHPKRSWQHRKFFWKRNWCFCVGRYSQKLTNPSPLSSRILGKLLSQMTRSLQPSRSFYLCGFYLCIPAYIHVSDI